MMAYLLSVLALCAAVTSAQITDGCALFHNDTGLADATLQRHLDAFGDAKLDDIMADYHPECVLQVPEDLGGTICGIAAIRSFFDGFFVIKPAGSPIYMKKQESVCATTTNCASYIWYNMSSDQINFPEATDTFVYNAHGQIVSQTFAGINLLAGANNFDVASIQELSTCGGYNNNTELYGATLQRHLDAFGDAKIDDIMADYNEFAVLQVPEDLGGTICGLDAIRDFFAGFFEIKPAGSPIYMKKQETVCGTASPCVSYIWYNMSSAQIDFPQSTDTFVYNAQGQIASQTFAGINLLA